MKIYKELEQWTQEWLDTRKWVITWTKLKWVLWWPKANLTEIYTLLSDIYIEEEDGLRPYEIIERWHELEPIAKAKYEELTWYTVEEVGFITTQDWLWLSPDGIISIENKYSRAIEIKCPMWKNYMKYLLEDKIPDEYKAQVVNYFVVMEDLIELDFIIFHPWTSVEIKSLHIIKVTREQLQKDIDKANEKIVSFKKQWDELKNTLINGKLW